MFKIKQQNILYIPFPIFICVLIFEGKRHDAGILVDTRLLNLLEQFAFSSVGESMCLYGYPAYPMSLRVHLQASFRDARLTAAMDSYNQSMSH